MLVEPIVYVVDDDAAVRESLLLLIESVGLKARAFASAQEFINQHRPDLIGCLLADVRMPGMSGLELQEHLNGQSTTLPIILITGHADVAMAVRAMKAGAWDFIEKPFSDQLLLDRINTAIAHSRKMHAHQRERDEIRSRLSLLSPRERTVMERVVSGKSNKTIAAELGLSQKTVEVHRAHVMEKVRAESLAELVQLALKAG